MAMEASTVAAEMICATGAPPEDLFRLCDTLFAIRDRLNSGTD